MLSNTLTFTKAAQGAKKTLSSDDDWTDAKAAWVSAIIAAGFTLLTIILGLPLLRRWAGARFDADGKPVAPAAAEDYGAAQTMEQRQQGDGPAHMEMRRVHGHDINGDGGDPELAMADGVDAEQYGAKQPPHQQRPSSWLQRARKAATRGVDVDIHDVVETDSTVHDIHAKAEVFEPRVEYAFRYLQVFSAICVIFAHGAGEVCCTHLSTCLVFATLRCWDT